MYDLDRLTQLVTQRAPALALFARQWVDAASADDVVQEALTALFMQRPQPADPVAWMFRAVRNAAIDQARSSTRRRRREESIARGRAEWFDSRVDAVMNAEAAEAALRQLDTEHGQVVVLRIWGDLGFARIAQILDLSVSTIHDRYTAALDQMRRGLENPCPNKMT